LYLIAIILKLAGVLRGAGYGASNTALHQSWTESKHMARDLSPVSTHPPFNLRGNKQRRNALFTPVVSS
jgi:hypothetical protein